MKARIAAAISGEIVVPFVAWEMNLVMQPGLSGRAAVTVLLDGKPIIDARGTAVGADGVARVDRSGMISLVAGVPQRRHVLTLASSNPGCAHMCSPWVHEENRARMLPTPG